MKQKGRAYLPIVALVLAVAVVSSIATIVIGAWLRVGSGSTMLVSRNDYELLERYKRLEDIQTDITREYLEDADPDKLMTGAAKGMVAMLGDPYSVYYTEEEYKELMKDLNGEYFGVGIKIQQSTETKAITVVQVFKGSPAEAAGLQKGDLLLGVNDTDIDGMESDQVVTMIRGEENTTVKLTLLRNGETITADVARANITVQRVSSKILEGNIGYVYISEFTGTAKSEYEAALKEFASKGIKGLIVDLRDNLGGYLNDACEMVDPLLPEGTIVYTENKRGERMTKKSDANALGIPLAVLVNEYSASASEIFAGAVQDAGVGKIVGTKTFGKGIVQEMFFFNEDGAALKLTTEYYYTASGRSIHKTGIVPDIDVALPEELMMQLPELLEAQDAQLQKAIQTVNSLKK